MSRVEWDYDLTPAGITMWCDEDSNRLDHDGHPLHCQMTEDQYGGLVSLIKMFVERSDLKNRFTETDADDVLDTVSIDEGGTVLLWFNSLTHFKDWPELAITLSWAELVNLYWNL